MAPDSKLRCDELTTSVTSTLARIILSTTQSPAQQIDKATNDTTNKNLPVELWIRVFEYIHNTRDYARPSVTMAYKRSLAVHGDSIEAAKILPAFERRTWKQSRKLYHIDRTSRAAALKLNMCLRVLEECKAPLRAMQHTRMVYRLINAGVYKESSPRYVAIQVTEAPEEHRRLDQAETAVWLLSGTLDVFVMHSLGLRTAKHVVLLDRCGWDTHVMLARGREIESAVYEFWRRNGIPAGVVEIV
jgi:hypothetical protein